MTGYFIVDVALLIFIGFGGVLLAALIFGLVAFIREWVRIGYKIEDEHDRIIAKARKEGQERVRRAKASWDEPVGEMNDPADPPHRSRV